MSERHDDDGFLESVEVVVVDVDVNSGCENFRLSVGAYCGLASDYRVPWSLEAFAPYPCEYLDTITQDNKLASYASPYALLWLVSFISFFQRVDQIFDLRLTS